MGLKASKIGFLQFIGCSGCLTSVIDSSVFRELWNKGYVAFFPMIKDGGDVDDCDVLLIEGSALKEDEKLLKKVRAKARRVISIGSCACFGGISSNVKELELKPIHSIIKVDLELPGCPPPENLMSMLLYALIGGREFKHKTVNVCSECPFHPCRAKYPIIIREIFPKRKTEQCLLEEGILCLGPITRAGCEAKCIVQGGSCYGCMGTLKDNSLTSLIDFLALLTIPKELKYDVIDILNLYGKREYVF
ncbi:MAG: hypothetical protein QXU47_02750 [Candidatus Bathyarchaeia archaeon]